MHHRARDADSLLFSTRQRDRHRLFLVQQAHLVEGRAGSLGDFLRSIALDLQRQRHVIEHRAVE